MALKKPLIISYKRGKLLKDLLPSAKIYKFEGFNNEYNATTNPLTTVIRS